MVSVAEDTQSNVDVVLKDMLYILEGIDPLLNWYNFWAPGTEKTRMIVPFSEAVASSVPSLLSAMCDKGLACASIMLICSSFVASYNMTSPLVGAGRLPLGGACGGSS